MKFPRLMVSAVLLLIGTLAFAQSHAHKSVDPSATSDAEKSFNQLKSLAGTWVGSVKMIPAEQGEPDDRVEVSLRITSRGNAIVHEMKGEGTPDDPTRYDHPVTMFYTDEGRLLLTHYCDAGNRPRMIAKLSPDGKTVEFDFLDISGGTQNGHMHNAVFTMIDANHHTEEWTYVMPGNKPARAHLDLVRANLPEAHTPTVSSPRPQ